MGDWRFEVFNKVVLRDMVQCRIWWVYMCSVSMSFSWLYQALGGRLADSSRLERAGDSFCLERNNSFDGLSHVCCFGSARQLMECSRCLLSKGGTRKSDSFCGVLFP